MRRFLPVTIALVTLAVPTAADGHTALLGKKAHAQAVLSCPTQFTVTAYKQYARKVYRRARVSSVAHARLRAMHVCQRSFNARKAVGRWHRGFIADRIARRDPWKAAFAALSAADQSWARNISTCESGNRQIAREGGYLSYFQWVLSTWHLAGGAGNPENVGWYEQAVRAVRWRNRTSTMQWPACSVKLGYA